MTKLVDEARDLLPAAIELRRSIHTEPELGLELPRTAAKVMRALDGLPVELREGRRTTSVVADLRGRASGKTIVLRADMDALPLQEDTEVAFKSRIAGQMHACGHDAHTAMLAGAARLLAAHRDELAGTARFMFQPGEEGYAGAQVMLDEGLLQAPAGGAPPSAAFALHATPRWASGTLSTRSGPVLASTDEFRITVRGRGGHASMPHLAADPVPVACEIVLALQTFVTRSVSIFDPGVVTVGKIQAGSANNIIPEIATAIGTVRTLSGATRRHITAGIERLARGIADGHGLHAEVEIVRGYPVTVNDDTFADFVLNVGREVLGEQHVFEQPSPQMAGEDFSYVLEQVPGVMASLGTRPPEFAEGEAPNAHSNRYLLHEDAMVAGIAMYAGVALAYLRQP